VARVVAYIPDLLFGSNVVGTLESAGHEVDLVGEGGALTGSADVLIVDLTADAAPRLDAVRALIGSIPSLAFYAHVETDVRMLAEAAGVDLVVPRSRMAREGPALVERLLATA
jgi:hypothetical protein